MERKYVLANLLLVGRTLAIPIWDASFGNSCPDYLGTGEGLFCHAPITCDYINYDILKEDVKSDEVVTDQPKSVPWFLPP